MKNPLANLRQEIEHYVRRNDGRPGIGPLVMRDVLESALACQQRIDRLGYRWNPNRLLWRASSPR